MTDGDAIYAAILAEPGEDLHRLAYADWLEETAGQMTCPWCQGSGWRDSRTRTAEMDADEYGVSSARCDRCGGNGTVDNGHERRAEFIRVQVELARFPEREDDFARLPVEMRSEFHRLLSREDLLFSEHKNEWFDVPAILYHGSESEDADQYEDLGAAIVRCGFVYEIRMTHDSFLAHLPALARHPITRVVLTDREPLNNAGVGTYFGEAPGPADTWYWLRGRGLQWEVPPEMWGPELGEPFASEQAALDALSAACVRLLAQTRAQHTGVSPSKG